MGFDLDDLVRENIKALAPYSSARSEHAGNAGIYLDANENAFGSPFGMLYDRYPDPLQTELKRSLSEESSVAASQIFIGNGSDEAIDLIIRIFCRPGLDNILICPPTYGMYEVAAGINDVAVKRANLTREFDIDIDAIFEAIDAHTKLIFLCSPNNPTGNSLEREAMRKVLVDFHGVVVVDEAYIHYSNKASFVEDLNVYPNLVVLQTFSKAWGLAALRVGLAFASEGIIGLLNKVKPPYNVGQPAQGLVIDALRDKRSLAETIERTIIERTALEHALGRFPSVHTIYPSDANFLLIKVADAAGLYRFFISEGIVVRNRSNVALCDQCLRITVGTTQENKALLSAFEKYETSSIH